MGGWSDDTGAPQMEFLYGGSGDDKIWMVSPGEIALDIFWTDENYGFGGLGNDYLYGTDSADRLNGDFVRNGPIITETDLIGGDDVIKAYGGNDSI